MLEKYMESDQYYEMIEEIVEENEEFKKVHDEFSRALDNLNLDRKNYDTIDHPAIGMMTEARDIAYKKGFQDGVRLIMECMSSDNSQSHQTVKVNSMMEDKDFREVWNCMAGAHNKLMDLLAARGINLDIVKELVEELESASAAYGTTMTRLQETGNKGGVQYE